MKIKCPNCNGKKLAWTNFGNRDRVYELCHKCQGAGYIIKTDKTKKVKP